jgi:hypothetical protein
VKPRLKNSLTLRIRKDRVPLMGDIADKSGAPNGRNVAI